MKFPSFFRRKRSPKQSGFSRILPLAVTAAVAMLLPLSAAPAHAAPTPAAPPAATASQLTLTVPTQNCTANSWLQVTTPDGKGKYSLTSNTLTLKSTALTPLKQFHRFTVQTFKPVDGCTIVNAGVLTVDGVKVTPSQRALSGGATLQVSWLGERVSAPVAKAPTATLETTCEVIEGPNTFLTITNPNAETITAEATFGKQAASLTLSPGETEYAWEYANGDTISAIVTFNGETVFNETLTRDCAPPAQDDSITAVFESLCGAEEALAVLTITNRTEAPLLVKVTFAGLLAEITLEPGDSEFVLPFDGPTMTVSITLDGDTVFEKTIAADCLLNGA